MNKCLDGFVAFGDSYKPVTITSDRKHFAHISFVGDQIVIRPGRNAHIVYDHAGPEGMAFQLVPAQPAEAEPDKVADLEARAQEMP